MNVVGDWVGRDRVIVVYVWEWVWYILASFPGFPLLAGFPYCK